LLCLQSLHRSGLNGFATKDEHAHSLHAPMPLPMLPPTLFPPPPPPPRRARPGGGAAAPDPEPEPDPEPLPLLPNEDIVAARLCDGGGVGPVDAADAAAACAGAGAAAAGGAAAGVGVGGSGGNEGMGVAACTTHSIFSASSSTKLEGKTPVAPARLWPFHQPEGSLLSNWTTSPVVRARSVGAAGV
jgi:hypothetical protein